jgi:hypothetical protein
MVLLEKEVQLDSAVLMDELEQLVPLELEVILVPQAEMVEMVSPEPLEHLAEEPLEPLVSPVFPVLVHLAP